MSHENVQESLGKRTLKDGSVHRMRGRALQFHSVFLVQGFASACIRVAGPEEALTMRNVTCISDGSVAYDLVFRCVDDSRRRSLLLCPDK
jgi:hypothetical protein